MKHNIFKKKQQHNHLVKRVTLFDIFQLFNVWLNRRHLDSHTYLLLHSVCCDIICHVAFGKLHYTHSE